MMIFLFILIIVIITKIELRVINILDETDVYIKIGLIKIHIDYDMFIKSVNKIAKDTNISFNSFRKGIGYYAIAKNIINGSNVNIKKFNIIKKSNNYDLINIYLNTTYYTIGNLIKNFLINNTNKQDDISFYVIASNDNDFDINIDLKFSLILFAKSFLFNIKNIIKLKKDMV